MPCRRTSRPEGRRSPRRYGSQTRNWSASRTIISDGPLVAALRRIQDRQRLPSAGIVSAVRSPRSAISASPVPFASAIGRLTDRPPVVRSSRRRTNRLAGDVEGAGADIRVSAAPPFGGRAPAPGRSTSAPGVRVLPLAPQLMVQPRCGICASAARHRRPRASLLFRRADRTSAPKLRARRASSATTPAVLGRRSRQRQEARRGRGAEAADIIAEQL